MLYFSFFLFLKIYSVDKIKTKTLKQNSKFDLYKEALIKNSSDQVKCTAWEYAMDDKLGNTWTSEWNLVCESEYLKNVAEMFFLVGVATGGIISGYLSDKFGRRTMLFLSVVLQTIFGESFDKKTHIK